MSTSVGTKARKKQPSTLPAAPAPPEREIEQALLALESACMHILDSQFTAGREDIERLTWQRRFKNIVTPVSLALVECKGPRRFHYHYRHRAHDDSVLYPVLEPNPLATLARVCAGALHHCAVDLTGIDDRAIVRHRNLLEHALRDFLQLYQRHFEA